MPLKDNYDAMKENQKNYESETILDADKYQEYMKVCDGFQIDLKELEKSIDDGNNKETLESFYSTCIEKEEIDEFVENYKKEVGEKYSKYVIENLDNEDDEKKTNTNQIVRLTPELVQNLLDKVEGEEKLDLSGLEALEVDVAQELIKYEGDELYLDKLEKLEPDVSTVLAGFKGKILSLKGLPTFDEGVENLKSFGGEGKKLYLTGITQLTEDDITKIKEFNVESINFGKMEDDIVGVLSEIDGKTFEFEDEKDEDEKDEDEKDEDEKDEDEKDKDKKDEEKKDNDKKEDGEQSKFVKFLNKVGNWIKEKRENFKNKEWVKKIRAKIKDRLEGKNLIDFIIDKIF